MTTPWMTTNAELVESIASEMDLRLPNAEALAILAKEVSRGDGREVIADLATGVGKTYLAAALVEYLSRSGVRNVLVVTPGSTVLNKTIQNFTPGSGKFIAGGEVQTVLITRDNFARGEVADALENPAKTKLFVFTIQTLVSPTAKANRKAFEENEILGTALYSHLQNLEDLVVIVDEHHVIREKAERFNAAVRGLNARAIVGLTATPDKSDLDAGRVVYRYPLAAAIADGLVKVPVVVYRQDGRKDLSTQLADACVLRDNKAAVWAQYSAAAGLPPARPVLFVVCQTKADAEELSEALKQGGLLDGPGEVLTITSDSSDEALARLSEVEDPDSKVKAIVSVDMLKEGWDVRNIAVILARRALASETLTEQILGRGLRLPFGRRTDVPAIDQVDIVAHESYSELLRNKDALLQRLAPSSTAAGAPSLRPALEIDYDEHEGEQSTGFIVKTAPDVEMDLDGLGPAELLLAVEMGEKQKELQAPVDLATPMPLNPLRPIVFPLAKPTASPSSFTLQDVDLVAVEQQGSMFKNDQRVRLVRRAINAQRDLNGDVELIEQLVASADAAPVIIHSGAIKAALLSAVVGSGMVEPDLMELLRAQEIIDAFLGGAGIKPEEEWEWSVDHASRAKEALLRLIRTAQSGRHSRMAYSWVPATLPSPRPKPLNTRSVWQGFSKGVAYGPWQKSIERFATFDSESAEFALAHKLDAWDEVVSWQRIYTFGAAWITWKGGRYYPDFVVTDRDGIFWVIEAKSDKAAVDSTEVQEKMKAATEWVERVTSAVQFGKWRYRLVSEMDIAAATAWQSIAKHPSLPAGTVAKA